MSLVRKLAHFVALSPDEVALLDELQSTRRVVRRHREIITEGRKYDALFVLIEGFCIRSRILNNGGRQILNVALPGDFVGFPGCFLPALSTRSRRSPTLCFPRYRTAV
jgi:CRP-like cAMP-binding protein